jgi:GNAT superfamily N-acetyltransferase
MADALHSRSSGQESDSSMTAMKPGSIVAPWQRWLGGVLRRLRHIGIQTELLLIVREGQHATGISQSDAELACGFLTSEDIPALVALESWTDPDTCRKWFAEGKMCFGARQGNKLVAKMWCDLESFNHPPCFRRLARDEAYLFAAYADPEARGRNIAPIMRERCYAALSAMGRQRFYSYTDFFNMPARRFKEKLGAVNESLKLHVLLFGRWSSTWTLRRYVRSLLQT